MPLKTKSKCIIFDLDGTLVYSESISCRVLLELIPEFDEGLDAAVSKYQGRKLTEILLDIENRFRCAIPLNFEIKYRERVSELFDKELKPVPGAIEMLNQVYQPRCVASSGPMEKIKHSLRVTGLSRYFGSNLFSAYEIGYWKPHPGLFLHAARKMNFEINQCIVVEDSVTGIEAARSAGMDVLHFSTVPIEPNSKSYRVFSEMADLPELLVENEKTA